MNYNPSFPFKRLLFGLAFSPNLKVNLIEVSRIAVFFKAELFLVHVGPNTPKKEEALSHFLNLLPKELNYSVHWKEGKPVDVILSTCINFNIDLLILGALQKENLYKFYMGSIARNLTRKVHCSVMLLIKPSEVRVPCQHIVVNGLEAPRTEQAIIDSFHIAQALNSPQITIVEEIRSQEVVKVDDDKSLREATIIKEKIRHREYSRVESFLEKIPEDLTKNIKIKTQSIFGKRGYSIGHYAEVVRADLLIMNAPEKTRLIDRVFPHDLEYILSDLPTDVIIIRD